VAEKQRKIEEHIPAQERIVLGSGSCDFKDTSGSERNDINRHELRSRMRWEENVEPVGCPYDGRSWCLWRTWYWNGVRGGMIMSGGVLMDTAMIHDTVMVMVAGVSLIE